MGVAEGYRRFKAKLCVVCRMAGLKLGESRDPEKWMCASLRPTNHQPPRGDGKWPIPWRPVYRLNTVRLWNCCRCRAPEDVRCWSPILRNFRPANGFTAGSAIGAAQLQLVGSNVQGNLENAIPACSVAHPAIKFRCRICRTKFIRIRRNKKPHPSKNWKSGKLRVIDCQKVSARRRKFWASIRRHCNKRKKYGLAGWLPAYPPVIRTFLTQYQIIRFQPDGVDVKRQSNPLRQAAFFHAGWILCHTTMLAIPRRWPAFP